VDARQQIGAGRRAAQHRIQAGHFAKIFSVKILGEKAFVAKAFGEKHERGYQQDGRRLHDAQEDKGISEAMREYATCSFDGDHAPRGAKNGMTREKSRVAAGQRGLKKETRRNVYFAMLIFCAFI
jgi:hypothetical protein